MVQTVAQLIDANGGSIQFAAGIGATPDAVRMMKHRNKLPRSVWPEIVAAFPDVTLDTLKRIEAANGLRNARAA